MTKQKMTITNRDLMHMIERYFEKMEGLIDETEERLQKNIESALERPLIRRLERLENKVFPSV